MHCFSGEMLFYPSFGCFFNNLLQAVEASKWAFSTNFVLHPFERKHETNVVTDGSRMCSHQGTETNCVAETNCTFAALSSRLLHR